MRTDATYPAGFMDVISIPKTGNYFRLLYDTKGRFRVHEVSADEAKYKLCKVRAGRLQGLSFDLVFPPFFFPFSVCALIGVKGLYPVLARRLREVECKLYTARLRLQLSEVAER